MPIEKLAAWGEFIGGLAVVSGLIFVALQLHISNREARIERQKIGDSGPSHCAEPGGYGRYVLLSAVLGYDVLGVRSLL